MSTPQPTTQKIAAVRVRGVIGINKETKDTLAMLNLHRKNFCVVLPKTSSFEGMMSKVKDYVTWGDISEETLSQLQKQRGKEGQKFYRLNPPRKGFGRNGIKASFSRGGALGNRGAAMDDLIKRMI